MSHPLRPPSERYAVCCSVPDSGSFCSQDGRHLSSSSDDDNNPVFSISKSSANVLTSSPHQRDTAFARLEVRHSSEQNCELSTSQNNLLLTKQNLDLHNPSSQALSERWISSMQRWSSCSPQSRSSTPDTVIFKGSQPSNIMQEKLPDSSKLASPPARTPSPLTPAPLTPAPLTPAQLTPAQLTPAPLTPAQLTPAPLTPAPLTPAPLTPARLTPLQNTNKQFVSSENQEDSLSNPYSPQFSPLRAKLISPLPPKELLCFTFPSPVSSSVSLEKFAAEDPLYAIKKYEMDASLDELLTDISSQNLELQFENQDLISPDFANSTPTCKPPLVTSFSDPYLGVCCRCNKHFCKNNIDFRNLGTSKICEEGTMTSNVELVEIGVQTFSPIGSWWNLKRNYSNVGSQSILGSPPGSRLNLRSPVGSHSNLVSPSSSMFVIHSDEDEIKVEKEELFLESSSNAGIVRRRSCLKIHDENRELGRRSSMKQVQWDEDGMTWDVHGAAIDPEELNMAIQKHLELKCNVEEEEKDVKTPKRKSSKKKRAPKPPVNLKPPEILIEGRRKEEWREEERRERKGEQIEEREEEEMRRGSLSPGIVQRKRSMIRPFKKPGCCGGSSKHN